MPPTRGADDGDLDVVRRDLLERIAQRFGAAVHVGLDQQLNARHAAGLHLAEDVLELRGLLMRELRLALAAVAELRDVASLALVRDDLHVVAGHRRSGEAEHDDGRRRARERNRLAGLVEHRADAAVLLAREQDVADLQLALVDQDGRDGAAAALEARLEHDAGGRTGVGGLEVEQLGLQQQRIEQLVDALPRQRRNADEQRLAAPLLGDQLVLRELPANAIEIAAGLVDLVDRDDDRHARRFRVLDRLDRLRHDAVVGRDDEHDDVRDLGAARAHGRERRVARRVEERDAALRRLDVVGADVLRDAAGLAGGDSRAADVVEQRRLAVVDVAHDRDDGRARDGFATRSRPPRRTG